MLTNDEFYCFAKWVSDETTLNQIVICCGNIAQILKINETCKVPKKVAHSVSYIHLFVLLDC